MPRNRTTLNQNRNMYRVSTSPANSDPCGGNMSARNHSILFTPHHFIYSHLDNSFFPTRGARPLGAEHAPQKDANEQDRQDSADAHEVGGEQDVGIGGRIVVIAEQQNLFDGHCDPVFGGFREREFHIHGPESNAIEIPRDLAFGSQDENGGGVRELLLARVVAVMKSNLFGELLCVAIVIAQEVPAGGGPVVAAQIHGFLLASQIERFLRIDADGNHFVFRARGPLDLSHGGGLAVENQVAQHGAG